MSNIKAIGLLSGGLDSLLAANLLTQLGIEVHAVYFRQPWDEKDPQRVRAFATQIDMTFHVVDLSQDYLDMLKSPQYGYGKAFNPCIDCHRFMVQKAGELMKETGAQFVFSGEVLAQRPMSQNKQTLPLIEKGTGLEGYLLRPLSAKLLAETIPEKQGWVDREQMLAISGRSRSEQLRLAEEWGIKHFFPTGGGCLITEVPFGNRMKDFLSWPYREPKEVAVLKWGRYFRFNENVVVIVGRDQRENELLERYAHDQDYMIRCENFPGPQALIKSIKIPDEDVLARAAGLVQHFSKFKNKEPQEVVAIKKASSDFHKKIMAQKISDREFKDWVR